MKISHIVGIDEAGRGPLAGPVSVGAVIVPIDFDWDCIPGVGDSKKVSLKNREAIFERARVLQREKVLQTAVALITPKIIDSKGITYAVRSGIERNLKHINPDPQTTKVLLDGLLKAPDDFIFQETIIKGDAKEKVIGLASILAKVTRDRYMISLAKQLPQYAFEVHKGYGTKLHRQCIETHGLSPSHRVTFCSRYVHG